MHKTRFIINSLTEFVPIALFIAVAESVSFSLGVKVLIVSSVIALLISYFLEKRLPYFGLFAATTILFFGLLTVIFDNPAFIIVKDTLYYFFFALLIAVSLWYKKPALKFFFKDYFLITSRGWRILSMRWFFFFIALGIGNEVARATLTPEMWAIYKGVILLVTWAFGFYQLKLTKKERLSEGSAWGLRIK
jgi:intracellular septation protein